MAEILVKAVDATNPDGEKDRRGCYKRGMPVLVMEDGHEWGAEERLPKFIVIKVPTISVATVARYALPQTTIDQFTGQPVTYRRRRWQIQWNDLPAAARQKLASTGQLVIKAGGYAGAYDYTWAQVKGYFLDYLTGLRETADL